MLVDLRCPGEFSALLQEPVSVFKLCALGDANGLQYRFFHLLARRKKYKKAIKVIKLFLKTKSIR